ncbi:hypothetical protein PISMIDRAFT_492433 [Pisolithus microcarpus 441]|uniref:Uncharacterized protein n=1 Tax=Pisolithus microcarpus 441 TaxID=765257 RepID=A0A0C9Z0U5_9AGAM|nr:hypothetical protein PISMIDRAFT_492433 [Pisolithus microcarpus 441]
MLPSATPTLIPLWLDCPRLRRVTSRTPSSVTWFLDRSYNHHDPRVILTSVARMVFMILSRRCHCRLLLKHLPASTPDEFKQRDIYWCSSDILYFKIAPEIGPLLQANSFTSLDFTPTSDKIFLHGLPVG